MHIPIAMALLLASADGWATVPEVLTPAQPLIVRPAPGCAARLERYPAIDTSVGACRMVWRLSHSSAELTRVSCRDDVATETAREVALLWFWKADLSANAQPCDLTLDFESVTGKSNPRVAVTAWHVDAAAVLPPGFSRFTSAVPILRKSPEAPGWLAAEVGANYSCVITVAMNRKGIPISARPKTCDPRLVASARRAAMAYRFDAAHVDDPKATRLFEVRFLFRNAAPPLPNKTPSD